MFLLYKQVQIDQAAHIAEVEPELHFVNKLLYVVISDDDTALGGKLASFYETPEDILQKKLAKFEIANVGNNVATDIEIKFKQKSSKGAKEMEQMIFLRLDETIEVDYLEHDVKFRFEIGKYFATLATAAWYQIFNKKGAPTNHPFHGLYAAVKYKDRSNQSYQLEIPFVVLLENFQVIYQCRFMFLEGLK